MKDEGTATATNEEARMKATTRPEGLLRRRLTFSRAKLGSRLRRRQRMKDEETAPRAGFLVSPLAPRPLPLVVQLRFEPRLLQHSDDLQDMVMSASFQDEVHFRGLHR